MAGKMINAIYYPLSIHINPITPQLLPRHLDLAHQLLIRFRYIIERKNTPPKLEQEVGTERYENPEGKLWQRSSESLGVESRAWVLRMHAPLV